MKRTRQKVAFIQEVLNKRLEAVLGHTVSYASAIAEGKWQTALDEMYRAEEYIRKCNQDIVDIRDLLKKSKDQKKKEEPVVFERIDSFNRPVFQSLLFSKNFFGSVDKLFDLGADEEEVLKQVTAEDLLFFGASFGCEPMGDQSTTKLRIVKKCDVHKYESSP